MDVVHLFPRACVVQNIVVQTTSVCGRDSLNNSANRFVIYWNNNDFLQLTADSEFEKHVCLDNKSVIVIHVNKWGRREIIGRNKRKYPYSEIEMFSMLMRQEYIMFCI